MVYDRVFFDQQAEGSLSSARVVLPMLFQYFRPRSIVDVGCGRGTWLKAAAEYGVKQLLGIDGDYVERDKLLIDPLEFQAWNLVDRIEIPKRFDLAISVEVAEHLPFYRAETFVADLVKLSDLVLFSAALPYQGGTDHVNEQWLEFWAIFFRRHGYVPCDLFRNRIWGNKSVDFWYSQNLVLFCKQDLARELFPTEMIATHRPLSFPHPLTFIVNVTRYRPLSAQALDLEFHDYHSLLAAHLSGETDLPLLKILGATGQAKGAEVVLFPHARTRVENVQDELAAQGREIERLEEEVAARDNQIAQQESENRRLEGELAQQESENRRLKDNISSREATIGSLSKELADRIDELNAVRSSFPWKIIAAPRWLASRIPVAIDLARRSWRSGFAVTATKVLARVHRLRYARLVAQSGLFDRSYYLAQNPDVAKAGVDPLWHYFIRGAHEWRNPHPLFDTGYYLSQNPDVAKAGVNALAHYLVGGAYEGRDPHPHFDSSFYLEKNPDVAEAHLNPLAHYVGPGVAEGRDPNPNFDTSSYLEQNPEVALKGLNPLVHHLARGYRPPLVSASAPPPPQADSGRFDLRVALRSEFEESGRALLDSEYDSDPLVSVIIPCYNYGHHLEDAVLSSLLACSYPLEIIVVDDGSTDPRSVALIDELAAEYKFTLLRQANKGRAGARNTGIQHARGKFIQFLDADDLLAPGKIDIQVDELSSDPEAGICVCEYEFCDSEGLNRRSPTSSTMAGFSFSRSDFMSRWERGFFIPIHSALFRRELLEKVEFKSLAEAAEEDPGFWRQVTANSPKFKFNPAVLVACRNHDQEKAVSCAVGKRTAAKETRHGPMVSVVIRCYNYGRYLDDAVQSVLSQTFQDFEIVVVDDGSTDPETIRILDQYNQPKTKLVRTSNQGICKALNNGVAECTGEYILPLDADDKVGSTYLERAVRVLEETESIGIVYCKAEFFGEASGAWELPAYRFPDILLGNVIFNSAMFRRSDWVKVNGYNPQMIYGWEDYDFWLSLIELGREVYCIPETLFFCRKHSGSTSTKMKREHYIYSFLKLFRNHPKLYMEHVPQLLNERPRLRLDLERFIHDTHDTKEETLELAWGVIEELLDEIRKTRVL